LALLGDLIEAGANDQQMGSNGRGRAPGSAGVGLSVPISSAEKRLWGFHLRSLTCPTTASAWHRRFRRLSSFLSLDRPRPRARFSEPVALHSYP
jgi:hypothetical protein